MGACKVCDAICSTNPFYMNMCSKHLVEAKLKQADDERKNQGDFTRIHKQDNR